MQRRTKCFGCNKAACICNYCEYENSLDNKGIEASRSDGAPNFKDVVFCDTCINNQSMRMNALVEFEGDNVDCLLLDHRYPIVCDSCEKRVTFRLQQIDSKLTPLLSLARQRAKLNNPSRRQVPVTAILAVSTGCAIFYTISILSFESHGIYKNILLTGFVVMLAVVQWLQWQHALATNVFLKVPSAYPFLVYYTNPV